MYLIIIYIHTSHLITRALVVFLSFGVVSNKFTCRHYQKISRQSSALMMSWFQVQKRPFLGFLLIRETNTWKGFFMSSLLKIYFLWNAILCWNHGNWIKLADVTLWILCSGLSHSYSTHGDKNIVKLSKLTETNRRFGSGRAPEPPAINQVVILEYLY